MTTDRGRPRRSTTRLSVDRTSRQETRTARTSTSLNVARDTEEAFTSYRAVFAAEFVGGIARFGDPPAQAGRPPVGDDDKRPVVSVQLPILGGHPLRGTDASDSTGFELNRGNGVDVCPDPDTRAEADARFAALAAGGTVERPLQETFRGDSFGSPVGRFGVQRMDNRPSSS